jgi:hypothetical protein
MEIEKYEECGATEVDKMDMREILAQRERGELKFEEIDASIEKIVAKKGVSENNAKGATHDR